MPPPPQCLSLGPTVHHQWGQENPEVTKRRQLENLTRGPNPPAACSGVAPQLRKLCGPPAKKVVSVFNW